tara:strand:+ start:370 stop:1353 length:984 start_codon:yes stop_codon:yes gene_type:complete
MCVILALETAKELSSITLDILKNAETTNPHGNGYATLKNGKVTFEKGVTMESIWKKIESGDIVAPCVIHARITSIGDTIPELTHPFIISENSENKMSGTLESNESAFFHNGTYSDFKQLMLQTALGSGRKLPSGAMSDSRGLAYCLQTLGIQALEYLDTTDKFAILDSSGLSKFGKWFDVSGVPSSNNYYEAYDYGTFPKNNYWTTDSYQNEDEQFYKEPEYNYNSAQKEITEFQSKPLDKKPTKSEHKKNVKYLKIHGWTTPEKMTRRQCRKAVESMARQNKIIEEIHKTKERVNTLSRAEWTDKHHKSFEDTYSIEDYEDCFVNS